MTWNSGDIHPTTDLVQIPFCLWWKWSFWKNGFWRCHAVDYRLSKKYGYPVLFNSAFHPSGVGKSSTSLLAGVKAGRVQLCRVAGNTMWSHIASDVPWLWYGSPINSYTLFHLYLFLILYPLHCAVSLQRDSCRPIWGVQPPVFWPTPSYYGKIYPMGSEPTLSVHQ